jgi:hypothetical protein
MTAAADQNLGGMSRSHRHRDDGHQIDIGLLAQTVVE